MTMTYRQWRESVIDKRVAKYGCTRADADFFTRPNDWWSDHLEPALNAGETLSQAVCRSVAEHGVFSLAYIARHWEDRIPRYTDFLTGRVIPRTGRFFPRKRRERKQTTGN